MPRYALAFVLTTLGAALALPYAAVAVDPKAQYEGRPLPALVKRLVWQKACDIPQAEAEGDTCKGEVCGFTRADGNPFKPQLAAWMELTSYQWALGPNTLQPALLEARLGSEDEIRGDARLALSLASGLPVDTSAEDDLLQLNPLLVRWVAKELLPPADQAMCGKTARDLYQAAFSGPTRLMVDVYAQLKGKGALKRVTVPELDKSFETKKGRYAAMCAAMGKQAKNQEESWPRSSACWWWLRRAASGGTDELALLFGKALRTYDPEAYKAYQRALPQEPKGTN
jgi:hypothetical protein